MTIRQDVWVETPWPKSINNSGLGRVGGNEGVCLCALFRVAFWEHLVGSRVKLDPAGIFLVAMRVYLFIGFISGLSAIWHPNLEMKGKNSRRAVLGKTKVHLVQQWPTMCFWETALQGSKLATRPHCCLLITAILRCSILGCGRLCNQHDQQPLIDPHSMKLCNSFLKPPRLVCFTTFSPHSHFTFVSSTNQVHSGCRNAFFSLISLKKDMTIFNMPRKLEKVRVFDASHILNFVLYFELGFNHEKNGL